MENNCLVKKLKSAVNNNSLRKIGEFKIGVVPSSVANSQLRIDSNSPFTAKVEGTGTFEDVYHQGTPLTSLSSQLRDGNQMIALKLPNDQTYTISVTPKYGFLKFLKPRGLQSDETYVIDLSEFEWCEDIERIDLYKNCVKGNISALKNLTSLDRLTLYLGKCSGDTSNLSNLVNLTYLNIDFCGVKGSSSFLRNLTSLTECYIRGVQNTASDFAASDVANLHNLTKLQYTKGASYEEVAQAQVGGGRTSGSLIILNESIGTTKTITYDPSATGGYIIS